jgi:hypothetical protein
MIWVSLHEIISSNLAWLARLRGAHSTLRRCGLCALAGLPFVVLVPQPIYPSCRIPNSRRD